MSDNERLLLEKFSDLLTGGDAGTWDQIEHAIATLTAEAASLRAENERLRAQSERPKCMYCTFGEDADFTVDDLKQHIENECDFHPLRKLRREILAALPKCSTDATDFQSAKLEAAAWRLLAREVWSALLDFRSQVLRYTVPPDARYIWALNRIDRLIQDHDAALTEPTQALRRAPADDAGQEREARGTH